MTKVVALAGGVGGAKLVWGLSKVIPREDLTIIVNTGDDFVHYGLNISPDLDTVMYTLAGLSNEKTGWGRKNETWNCLDQLSKLESKTWFKLGDQDLATHLVRTGLLKKGKELTEVTKILSESYSVKNRIYPMTDQTVSTMIITREYGAISFQEYFVKYQFRPIFIGFNFKGIERAKINPETRRYLEEAEIVVFCPSNPWLSIMPILAVEDLQKIVASKICVAVSPIVGHEAIKGPAAKIFEEQGITPSAAEVAKLYKGIIKGFVIDNQNSDECNTINGWGIIPLVTDTIMKDNGSKERLAKEVIDFASHLV